MKKIALFIVLLFILAVSCARIRQNRAAKNQPFKPHKDKPMQQKKHR